MGIQLPPVMPNILNPSLIVKPTPREMCVNYDVETINTALKPQSGFAAFNGNLSEDDDFILVGDDDNDNGDYGPCNTQQETNMYGTDDSIIVFFPNIDSPIVTKNNSPYGVLLPLLKEPTSILEGNCSVNKLSQYKEMLSNSIAKEKKELFDEQNGANGTVPAQPSGKMVSSSVRSNKRHRTHGTKHMTFH